MTWFNETIMVPSGFQFGDVEVSVGIIDLVTRRPAVRFAIEEVAADGWHLLTQMEIR